jgi:hypothetical protein
LGFILDDQDAHFEGGFSGCWRAVDADSINRISNRSASASAFAVVDSIAPATTAANAPTAGGGFAGKENMLVQRGRKGIAIWAHEVVGESGPFPGLDAHQLGARAASHRQRAK